VWDWIDDLFNKHQFVRRMLVLWAVWLITLVILRVTKDLALITTPVAVVVGSVTGLLTLVVTHYQWSRNKDK